MTFLKKQESLCNQLGNKDGLQACYGDQALILKEWDQLEEAMALLKKQETLCIELGLKASLGHCCWNCGLLARELKDLDTEKDRLQKALEIFSDLKMEKEQKSLQNELSEVAEDNKCRMLVRMLVGPN